MEWTKHWLSRSLFGRAIWGILASVAAITIFCLQTTGSFLVLPIMYGLAAFVLIIIGGVSFMFLTKQSKILRSSIEPEEAKTSIREWLDSAGLEVRAVPPTAEQNFFYVVTINLKKLTICQLKSKPRYLMFGATINFTPQDNLALDTLAGGVEAVIRALRISLASYGMGYAGVGMPLESISIDKDMFIADDFNEYQFIQFLYRIEGGIVLVNTICLPPMVKAGAVTIAVP